MNDIFKVNAAYLEIITTTKHNNDRYAVQPFFSSRIFITFYVFTFFSFFFGCVKMFFIFSFIILLQTALSHTNLQMRSICFRMKFEILSTNTTRTKKKSGKRKTVPKFGYLWHFVCLKKKRNEPRKLARDVDPKEKKTTTNKIHHQKSSSVLSGNATAKNHIKSHTSQDEWNDEIYQCSIPQIFCFLFFFTFRWYTQCHNPQASKSISCHSLAFFSFLFPLCLLIV